MSGTLIDPYKELPSAKVWCLCRLTDYIPQLLKNGRIKITSSSPFTPAYVTSHLTQASDPVSIYANRVQGRQIMLENPAKESKKKVEELEKRRIRDALSARKRLGVASRKEAKERGFWNFDKSQVTYVPMDSLCRQHLIGWNRFRNMLPLHHLWMDYMSELLGLSQPSSTAGGMQSRPSMPNPATMHAKLIKADLHGSMIKGQ